VSIEGKTPEGCHYYSLGGWVFLLPLSFRRGGWGVR